MAMTSLELIQSLEQAVKKEFDSNRRILSFDEYLLLVSDQPEKQTRGSARYLGDMMDHFGTTELAPNDPSYAMGVHHRFGLFDQKSLAKKLFKIRFTALSKLLLAKASTTNLFYFTVPTAVQRLRLFIR
jgi:hypothetical protein